MHAHRMRRFKNCHLARMSDERSPDLSSSAPESSTDPSDRNKLQNAHNTMSQKLKPGLVAASGPRSAGDPRQIRNSHQAILTRE
jgi:hypothetical protein